MWLGTNEKVADSAINNESVMSHAMVHIKMVYPLKVLCYELGFIS
jgi:hypothetical protein